VLIEILFHQLMLAITGSGSSWLIFTISHPLWLLGYGALCMDIFIFNAECYESKALNSMWGIFVWHVPLKGEGPHI
jgi:hypothetical protein